MGNYLKQVRGSIVVGLHRLCNYLADSRSLLMLRYSPYCSFCCEDEGDGDYYGYHWAGMKHY